ncbi:AAA family ATPase, partial [Corynebacterium nuruki]|uniref:AAA family ATPase n=1 Tax=Corynebacterium nuruki TaxID=1032851 RepID=UPI0039BEE566
MLYNWARRTAVSCLRSHRQKNEGKQNPNPKQISVIYGSNGAGKSTIARKLSGYTPGDSCNTVHFTNTVGEAVQPRSFVFNEDYILSNFREKSGNDGLDTIVMVGETAELQDEIDELHIEINESKENLNELVKSRISLTENIKETEENLRSGLSEEGGWRDRERKITGKSGSSRLRV